VWCGYAHAGLLISNKGQAVPWVPNPKGHHNAARACLVLLEATINALGFLIVGADVAAKIRAVNLDMAFQHFTRLELMRNRLTQLVGQHEGCLVLAINVAA